MIKALLLIAALLTQAVGQLPNQTGIVTGRLTKNGQPAANIRVSAMVIPEPGVSISEASSLASVVLTDSDGRYRLENIPPGRYYVTAGFLDVPTYYPGVASINSAKAVNVDAGVTTTGIDFTTAVSTGVTVSGRVVYPPGQLVPSNWGASMVGSQRPAPEGAVKADGSFEVSRVRPGNYMLRVSPWATTVIVGDEDVSGIELEAPYNVSGTVLVEGAGPLPNVALSMVSTKPGAEPQALTLSPAGVFSAQLTPGDYRLAVSRLPIGYSLKAITAGPLDLVANPLKVAPGNPLAPINVTLAVASTPWVSVSGKVSGPGFTPGSPYTATLTGQGLFAPMQANNPPGGLFEFPRVLPGDYTLSVTSLVTRKIDIHVGTTDLKDIDVSIPEMKDVTARVTIEGQQGGLPVLQNLVAANGAGAVLIVRSGPPQSVEIAFTDPSGTTSVTATRQPDGTFRMRLPVGERTVKAEASGYTVKSLSYGATDMLADSVLRVSSSETKEVEMKLVSSAQAGANVTFYQGAVNAVRLVTSTVTGGAGGVTYTFMSGPAGATNSTVYVGPDVARDNLLSSVSPKYPVAAEGVLDPVVLRAEIDKQGTVTDVRVVRGHPSLNDAAIAAVKQWRYRPYLLNNQPTAVVTTIQLGK